VTSSLNFTQLNITLNTAGKAYRYTLPGGHYLQVDDYLAILNISSVALTSAGSALEQSLNFSNSIAFPSRAGAIADVFFIYQNLSNEDTDESKRYSALELLLEWCVQGYNTTVENGVSNTTKLQVSTNFTGGGGYIQYYKSSADKNPYTISSTTHYSLQRYLQDIVHGTVFYDFGNLVSVATSDITLALWQPFNRYGQHITSSTDLYNTNRTGLEHILENVGTSMTNHIRMQPRPTLQPGTLMREQVVVEVRWAYVTAPILFTVLSIGFFSATLIYQQVVWTRAPAKHWKLSSLAVLHALKPDIHQAMGGLTSTSVLNQQAGKTHVRLEDCGPDGWRLGEVNPGLRN
jgi:hypothetical protein